MICEFQAFNREHNLIEHSDSIVVGVSGGADSVCLLHLLCLLQKEWELTLHVYHLHHGIRGKDADRDAEFVRKIAGELGLPCRIERVNVPGEAVRLHMSEEEAGRLIRYEKMEQYRKEHHLRKIATAHHRDDQAETVLFRLFRGTGPRGLAGIPSARGAIVRPLLFAGKNDIETWLKDRGVAWCEDTTNVENKYARNRIRNEILPMVEREINSEAGRHIAEAAEKIDSWKQYIGRMSRELYERVLSERADVNTSGENADKKEVRLYIPALQREDVVLQREVLGLALSELVDGAKDIGQIHFSRLLELMKSDTGKELCFPGGLIIRKSYDELVFGKRGSGILPYTHIECSVPANYRIEKGDGLWEFQMRIAKREDLPSEIPQKDYTKWFNYDKIKDSLVFRNPCEGDYFVIDKAGHRKKLGRYYVDQKIAREEREYQLVLAEGNHVLWAVPGRISEAYKVNKDTKYVLVITGERVPI